jgi:hypothetical protein
MTIPYIIKPDSATLFIKGRGVTVASDHANFKQIVAKLEDGTNDVEALMQLVDVVKSLGAERVENEVVSRGKQDVTFDVASGTLKYRGFPLSGYIATKAGELHRAGKQKPLQMFLAFLENLYQNPRSSIAERLYKFLEVGNMPLTEDGYFLAYKKIRDDWKDIHSGTMENKVGMTVEMPRVLVNDKDSETCSTGLHFCSYAYLGQFGSAGAGNRVVVLKINPADVVSIPADYNDTKGRCCKYEVLSEITDEAAKGPVLSQGPAVVAASAYRTPVQNAASVVAPSMHTKPYTAADASAARASATVPSVWPTAPVQPAAFAAAVLSQAKGQMSDFNLMALLQKLSNTQLVAIWNQMAIHQIDHFRDKATGVRRLMALTDRATLERLASV